MAEETGWVCSHSYPTFSYSWSLFRSLRKISAAPVIQGFLWLQLFGLTSIGIETVPTENSVQPMGDVIPPTGPQSSSSLRPCLSLVNEIRRCTRVQGSTVRTQISMAQGERARSVVDSSFFRQPVVRSGGAVHRLAAPPRRTLFPAAESLVAPASPSPTKDVFSIGDSNRNTN
jgi:hypothetical protein